MKETILVTGATGTVGSAVVQALSNFDVQVRAGVRSLIKGELLKTYPHLDLVEIDFHRPETLHAAFTGVSRVFMVTPFSDRQVDMGKAMIDEAKRAGVQLIVKLSAGGADAEPGIQLGRWHREVEQYLEQSGLNYVLLRPASYMQNFYNVHGESIRKRGKIYLPLGEGKVAYIDARDIASVAAKMLTEPVEQHQGKTYELTGAEALSGKEVADILSGVLEKEVMFEDVPEQKAREAMLKMEIPDWMADAMLELNRSYKEGLGANITGTVEELTGQRPHSFEEFCRDCRSRFLH